MNVRIGKEGRIVLPKSMRRKHGINEGDTVVLREQGEQIVLIPTVKYERPTQALYGSVEVKEPIDKPKDFARKYIRKKLRESTMT